MAREDGKRNFALRRDDGTEDRVFSGSVPRQAALKAARREAPTASAEDAADRVSIRLRERGTDKVHKYEGWSWEEAAPADSPDWMPEQITEANVSKQGVEHLDD